MDVILQIKNWKKKYYNQNAFRIFSQSTYKYVGKIFNKRIRTSIGSTQV